MADSESADARRRALLDLDPELAAMLSRIDDVRTTAPASDISAVTSTTVATPPFQKSPPDIIEERNNITSPPVLHDDPEQEPKLVQVPVNNFRKGVASTSNDDNSFGRRPFPGRGRGGGYPRGGRSYDSATYGGQRQGYGQDRTSNFDSLAKSPPNQAPFTRELPTRPVAPVKEEIIKDYFCDICKCKPKFFKSVELHEESVMHQMAVEKLDENARKAKVRKFSTVVEMLAENRRITLDDLTKMEDFQIDNQNEAEVAQAVIGVLCDDLYSYRLSKMPPAVRQALKEQGFLD